MAQGNRSKELWLIPKRVNLHQTICLIDGIIDRNYDGTSWNPQKQNNLGVNLKNWGATKDGKNISQQAIRTLVASIPQYLGYLYVNTSSTPNTICLTDAGKELWEKHKDELVKIPNLKDGEDKLITESSSVLKQMEKLQITNPIISKDCENIYLFPFRFILRILLEVDYLDQEEIAYYILRSRNDDEYKLVIKEIQNFRALPKENRKSIIDEFKKTHIGNITLVKASSAGYFISLCMISGIFNRERFKPDNSDNTLTRISIKNDRKDYVVNDLLNKYKDTKIYDFKDNLKLWIEYIGDTNRDYPPIDVEIKNNSNTNLFIQVFKDNIIQNHGLILKGDSFYSPMFINEKYTICLLNIKNGKIVKSIDYVPTYSNDKYNIRNINLSEQVTYDTLEELSNQIVEHCEARYFDNSTSNYLNVIKETFGIDKTHDLSLRGAYLEYYFYKLLSILKADNIIDDVFWNGKVDDQFGLPNAAPGGKTGTPDIIFRIDNVDYVLELTTIKPKAAQFSAEGSSVPDHIRLYKEDSSCNVVGIFSAPIIHERNTNAMSSVTSQYDIDLICISIDELLNILKLNNKNAIKNSLFVNYIKSK